MYQEKFVVAIKHNGKILREIGDIVKLPFGSEFTVLVKNLNSRRAKFRLHIDGTDVLDGTEIIVNANSEVEMKRFIRNGNMSEGNAYRFIERTQQIEAGPRGIKADDGVVRVEFWFEQAAPVVTRTVHYDDYYRNDYPSRFWRSGEFYGSTGDIKLKSVVNSTDYCVRGITSASLQNSVDSSTTFGATYSTTASTNTAADSYTPTEVNTAGITVPGSKVEQKFTTVYGFNAETQSHVIILRLVGRTADDVEVTAPVTVKTKQKCVTCGHVNKSSSKFCSQCGTSLEII